MPFDMSPQDPRIDQLARLELLGEIAARASGAQASWMSCLWSEAFRDPRTTGLLGCPLPSVTEYTAAAETFGLGVLIWGNLPLGEKRAMIADRIAELKAALAARTEQKETA